MTRAASVALLLSALVAGCPGSITNPTDAGTGGGSATGGGTSATGGGTSSTGGGSATGGGGSATGGGGSATGGGGSATGGGGGATGGGSATGGGTTDAGHFTFDGGPPDLSCLADAGLTANETEIIQLPQDTWLTLPNTDFSTFCHAHEDPSVNANEGCDAVIDDWSGGMFDDGNRLMVLFGGGHGGYYGNEVYGFDLATRAWKLLRTATPLDGGQTPSEPMYDGTPVSRHTYDGLVYLSDARQMLVFGGASAPMGYSVNTTWFFDLAQHTWSQRSDGPGSSAGHYHMGMAYDLATHTVYMRDDQGIWSYDAVQDTWAHLVDYGFAPYYPLYTTYNYRRGVVIDSQRLFLAAGGTLSTGAADVIAYDLDAGADVTSSFTMTGATSVVSVGGTGLDLDPRANVLVAWSGGAPAVMDLSTHDWTLGSGTGAPATQVMNGTYGRFRYVSYLNAFILVNEAGQNVFIYKLTPGCGP